MKERWGHDVLRQIQAPKDFATAGDKRVHAVLEEKAKSFYSIDESAPP